MPSFIVPPVHLMSHASHCQGRRLVCPADSVLERLEFDSATVPRPPRFHRLYTSDSPTLISGSTSSRNSDCARIVSVPFQNDGHRDDQRAKARGKSPYVQPCQARHLGYEKSAIACVY